ncbi:MAG: hypothetical protein OEY94_01055 [Alphaproteobacteria bacterium]|nr:hypothetical protein [Alphaproteobacteria bacterium]
MIGSSTIKTDIKLKRDFNAACTAKPKKSKKDKRPAPLSIRLSKEQRARLEEMAAGQSLNSYVKTVLFQGEKKRIAQPIKDHEKLALALGLLGKMGTLSTLESLLEASEKEQVYMPTLLQGDIAQCCVDIRLIRCYLIKALGIKAEG